MFGVDREADPRTDSHRAVLMNALLSNFHDDPYICDRAPRPQIYEPRTTNLQYTVSQKPSKMFRIIIHQPHLAGDCTLPGVKIDVQKGYTTEQNIMHLAFISCASTTP